MQPLSPVSPLFICSFVHKTTQGRKFVRQWAEEGGHTETADKSGRARIAESSLILIDFRV